MAISDTLAARIIEHVRTHDLSGDMLMLGRQRWVGARRNRSKRLLERTVKQHVARVTVDGLGNPDDGYSETFFHTIGFETVDSLDVSDFEGATITADLGAPVPPELHDRFDVIYDGGTCEHVFDLPMAFRNIDRMLKTGGVLIGQSPCNNWVNHGFYQLCPEVVFGFWRAAMGYQVLACNLQPLLPKHADHVVTTTDPAVTGKRPRLRGTLPNSPVILDYVVRKTQPTAGTATVKQTDYARRWDEADLDPNVPPASDAGRVTGSSPAPKAHPPRRMPPARALSRVTIGKRHRGNVVS